MSRPAVRITIREPLALCRGWEAQHACRQVGADPQWSDRGRGWVVESRFVPDVVAYVQSAHEYAVVQDITDDDQPAVTA